LLARPFSLRTPEMGDALVRIGSRLLINTRDLSVWHGCILLDLAVLRRLPDGSFTYLAGFFAHGA